MTEAERKLAAKTRVVELVQRFKRNEADYLSSAYNETQARTDYVTPLLEAFGWDVHNEANLPLSLREVIEEATVEVGEEKLSKRPDYELRLARQRKLFVEAKKPSVRIDRDREAAFQTRRYGYSASLPISVLSNFRQLAIYDCRPIPSLADDAAVARLHLYSCDDFESKFDEIWPLLSRDAVYSGDFDRRFSVEGTRRGAEQFDDLFLRQVRSWRARLAIDIHRNNPTLTSTELTYAVQLFLSRIVFLRICEDREIERYETLKDLPRTNTFDALLTELRRADAFYDSGLFRLIDDERLGIRISDDTLQSFIEELYYPQSPYTFAVVETEVLGEIYEQFLGEIIEVHDGIVSVVYKPEIREAGGVIPTPRYVVESILQRSLLPAINGKTPSELETFTIADICCGSGIFLLAVFEYLLNHHLEWYVADGTARHRGQTIFEGTAGQWHLTFAERRRILLTNIRGVDVDPNAVEVARFSLLLKLIEQESATGLRDYVDSTRQPALPELESIIKSGNSLVSSIEWNAADQPSMLATLHERINPLDWRTAFSRDFEQGGFSLIVANPPYTRIQHMQTYMAEELTYFQSAKSPYTTARERNFDKYALFIERSLTLLRPEGLLGIIVPHKFMITQAGRALRRLIATSRTLKDIVHFGVKPVFGHAIANYTCIMVMNRSQENIVRIEIPETLESWRYGTPGTILEIAAADLTEEPWQFANENTQRLFARIRNTFPTVLGELAEVSVGVQTSSDEIYMFKAVEETTETVTLSWNGRDWPIERSILKPCLHDVPVYAYERPIPNEWMIFPYEMVSYRSGVRARLYQPDQMKRQFPLCKAYFDARRDELEKRSVAGGPEGERQFYQFGRSQSLTKFDKPKIVVQVLTLEARNGYDDKNSIITGGGNGPYYMVRPKADTDITHYYLLAVLNHPLSEAFVRTETSSFRGGYYSHGKQYIENLPMPLPDATTRRELELLVAELIEALDAVKTARTPHQVDLQRGHASDLRKRVEEKMSAIFGLSQEEVAIASAVPIPS